MEIRVLGCSGGGLSNTGHAHHTSAYLVDSAILIDAGSGVLTLSQKEAASLTDIFITHTHLDHILGLPLIADAWTCCKKYTQTPLKPVVIHALPETIEGIQQHIFNDIVFPDFSRLPTHENPVLKFSPLKRFESVTIGSHTITAYPMVHVVPTVGYVVDSGGSSVFFSGDTVSLDAIEQIAKNHPNLTDLIVEMTFTSQLNKLATLSQHFSSPMLEEALSKLVWPHTQKIPKLWATHAKSHLIESLREEMKNSIDNNPLFRRFRPELLIQNTVIYSE